MVECDARLSPRIDRSGSRMESILDGGKSEWLRLLRRQLDIGRRR